MFFAYFFSLTISCVVFLNYTVDARSIDKNVQFKLAKDACPHRTYYDTKKGRCRVFPGGGQVIFIDHYKRCSNNYLGPKAHPEEKRHYYVCKKDSVVFGVCQDHEEFDDKLKECRTKRDNITLSLAEIVPICRRSGRFAIRSNCSLFYICDYNKSGKGFTKKILRCPGSTVFCPLTGKCSYSYRCTPTLVHPTNFNDHYFDEYYPACKTPGRFRSPIDCSLYYTCSAKSHGKFYQTRFRCPKGTLYDMQKETCQPASKVDCQYMSSREILEKYVKSHQKDEADYSDEQYYSDENYDSSDKSDDSIMTGSSSTKIPQVNASSDSDYVSDEYFELLDDSAEENANNNKTENQPAIESPIEPTTISTKKYEDEGRFTIGIPTTDSSIDYLPRGKSENGSEFSERNNNDESTTAVPYDDAKVETNKETITNSSSAVSEKHSTAQIGSGEENSTTQSNDIKTSVRTDESYPTDLESSTSENQTMDSKTSANIISNRDPSTTHPKDPESESLITELESSTTEPKADLESSITKPEFPTNKSKSSTTKPEYLTIEPGSATIEPKSITTKVTSLPEDLKIESNESETTINSGESSTAENSLPAENSTEQNDDTGKTVRTDESSTKETESSTTENTPPSENPITQNDDTRTTINSEKSSTTEGTPPSENLTTESDDIGTNIQNEESSTIESTPTSEDSTTQSGDDTITAISNGESSTKEQESLTTEITQPSEDPVTQSDDTVTTMNNEKSSTAGGESSAIKKPTTKSNDSEKTISTSSPENSTTESYYSETTINSGESSTAESTSQSENLTTHRDDPGKTRNNDESSKSENSIAGSDDTGTTISNDESTTTEMESLTTECTPPSENPTTESDDDTRTYINNEECSTTGEESSETKSTSPPDNPTNITNDSEETISSSPLENTSNESNYSETIINNGKSSKTESTPLLENPATQIGDDTGTYISTEESSRTEGESSTTENTSPTENPTTENNYNETTQSPSESPTSVMPSQIATPDNTFKADSLTTESTSTDTSSNLVPKENWMDEMTTETSSDDSTKYPSTSIEEPPITVDDVSNTETKSIPEGITQNATTESIMEYTTEYNFSNPLEAKGYVEVLPDYEDYNDEESPAPVLRLEISKPLDVILSFKPECSKTNKTQVVKNDPSPKDTKLKQRGKKPNRRKQIFLKFQ